MPAPLILYGFAAALLAYIEGGGYNHNDSLGDSPSADGGDPVSMPTPTDWDADLDAARGSVPLEFLQRWISLESGGNPASLGLMFPDGTPQEAGIAQVYFESPTQIRYGVTRDQLREGCSGNRVTGAVNRDAQVRSAVGIASDYILRAGNSLSHIGATWSDSDILCLAKLYHALPVLAHDWLPVAEANLQATDWDTFYAWVATADQDHEQCVAIDQAAGYQAGHGAAPFWYRQDHLGNRVGLTSLMHNAQLCGRGA